MGSFRKKVKKDMDLVRKNVVLSLGERKKTARQCRGKKKHGLDVDRKKDGWMAPWLEKLRGKWVEGYQKENQERNHVDSFRRRRRVFDEI